ncbi:MAG TPA: hypothetical protein PKG77_25670 [Phycisphaerae bacterium]|nr:hypothetical protein [Phycisphaerae bacterium]HQL76264.1 hypothetical protein [Phycisphaerae bacterium]
MADYTTFSDGELEEFAKEEQRKQILREVQAHACQQIVLKIQTELAERALRRKGFNYGDMVTVRFRDRQQDFRFEGIDSHHWSGGPRVRLRALTKKGKPFKQPDSYGPSIIPLMTRKEQVHG